MNKMKKLYANLGAVMTVATTSTTAMATGLSTEEVNKVVNPVVALIKSLLNPALAIVTALGLIYCIILGVKYAQCEEPQQREKAKNHLKNAIIGFVLIFVLMIALILLTPALKRWVNTTASNNNMDWVFKD